MTKFLLPILFVVTLAITEPSMAREGRYFQPPAGPRTSWRGRIYIRNGPRTSVYRERWGNGITATGGTVLTNLFANVTTLGLGYLNSPGVVTSLADGGNGESNRSFEVKESAAVAEDLRELNQKTLDRDVLLTELEKKEDLLRETMGLEKRARVTELQQDSKTIEPQGTVRSGNS